MAKPDRELWEAKATELRAAADAWARTKAADPGLVARVQSEAGARLVEKVHGSVPAGKTKIVGH